MIKRRTLLKALAQSSALPLFGTPLLSKALITNGYSGPLLLQIQAEGGWDVTSYCDPKVNQPGEKVITNWSKSAEPLRAGGIAYAPFGNNETFFERHHKKMLVINGIDTQTNSHTTGVLHNWSGRNAEGFPSLSALFAAHHSPESAMPYVNFGGFGATQNVVRFTRLQDNPEQLGRVLEPNLSGYHQASEHNDYDGPIYFRNTDNLNLIDRFRRERLERLKANTSLLGRQQRNLNAYGQALEGKSELAELAAYLPKRETIFQPIEGFNNTKGQIQLVSAIFEAGVSSAADVHLNGFDTHDDHDAMHTAQLSYLNEAIDLVWQLAEQGGYADRLTVVVGSDFGRTPHYNSQQGKDHWPIGSMLVMQSNPAWGDRAVGVTDPLHNAIAINPVTLEEDAQSGSIIYPKHVHKALRKLLNLEGNNLDQQFPFSNTESMAFFG
jgi:hypothetical protein